MIFGEYSEGAKSNRFGPRVLMPKRFSEVVYAFLTNRVQSNPFRWLMAILNGERIVTIMEAKRVQ